jgi:hypothetical protein
MLFTLIIDMLFMKIACLFMFMSIQRERNEIELEETINFKN